ncbi:Uma2 family endonuclease [Streptomyces sp. NPDC056656]|uniref:Uma2 family endonuclease n=1 Tax=Streptomyces sp. NPDC056656 TaxID=3345895 RepID=UPI0036BA9925
MMSPGARHQFVGHRLRKQLEPQLPDGVILMVETDVEDASLGILRTPDLVVVDETADLAHREALDPRGVHLIIEIVSRWNASNDYREKVADYPRMGVARRPEARSAATTAPRCPGRRPPAPPTPAARAHAAVPARRTARYPPPLQPPGCAAGSRRPRP